MRGSAPVFVLTLGAVTYAALANQAFKDATPPVDFDRDVMPILSQRCFKCHGPDATKAAAGLRLDLFDKATSKLSDGIPIVPGSPDASLVIKRVSDKDADMRMPPSDSGVKPLTPDQIATLRTWIKSGAKYAKHWAYIPPTMPKIPDVSNAKWCANPIDRFVLTKLDQAGLKPESEADKNTLAMRAAETLTGLPPTPAQLSAFRNDTKPGAYERYVDRLLTTPEYGEQQARYWLDAVRYGDTHGLQLDNERGVYPYRDWVIRAFNNDLPFNKFVEWQLAGDLLPKPTTEQLLATGYVRMNLTSNEGGAIAEEFLARNTFDRVDTASTVFLGLTIQCAKCHDHKYDPIKQKDYYGLYAYFDSTKDEPLDGNVLLPEPTVRAITPTQEAQLEAMSRRLKTLQKGVDPTAAVVYFERNHQPGPATKDWKISPVYASETFDQAFDKPNPPEPGQSGTVSWKPVNFEVGKDAANLVGRDNASVYVKGTVIFPTARTLKFGVSSDDAVKVWLNGKLIHSHKVSRGVNEAIDPVTGDFKAGENEILAKVVNGSGPDGLNIRLSDPNGQRIEDAMNAYRKDPANSMTIQNLRTTYLEVGPDTQTSLEYRRIQKERAELESSIPRSLIAQEMETPRPTFILKRGQYDQKGDAVIRHIPTALGTLPPSAPNDRLGFAQWLVAPSNPLLARVFVNRVWQQVFGTGIVKTSDDFGSQGEWPVNQPLLDYLAVTFERGGWSIKKLNRLIVTSAAFRQSSRITPAKLAKDPENRLISRGPRFRLDAEIIRDKALAASGLLVEELGGHGFKTYQPDGLWEGASDPASGTHFYKRDHGKEIYRRSMYLFWKRTAPPPIMVTFDSPVRDTCVVRRASTDTPLQALAAENEPTFLEASRVMAQHLLDQKTTDAKRLQTAFDWALGRTPRPVEFTILSKALAQYRKKYRLNPSDAKKLLMVGDAPQARSLSGPEQAAWMLICSTLMNTNEFLSLN